MAILEKITRSLNIRNAAALVTLFVLGFGLGSINRGHQHHPRHDYAQQQQAYALAQQQAYAQQQQAFAQQAYAQQQQAYAYQSQGRCPASEVQFYTNGEGATVIVLREGGPEAMAVPMPAPRREPSPLAALTREESPVPRNWPGLLLLALLAPLAIWGMTRKRYAENVVVEDTFVPRRDD